MTRVQPVSIRQPEIGALVDGAMTVLVRPIGRLATLRTGDLLWVREPFYVPKRFAHLRPTAAAAHGDCRPLFLADEKPKFFARHHAEFGQRRNARELPKLWHRQHLRLTAVDRVQLHDVAVADLQSAGWKSRDAFEIRWDQDAGFSGACANPANFYTANPQVLRLEFVRIPAPLPNEGD